MNLEQMLQAARLNVKRFGCSHANFEQAHDDEGNDIHNQWACLDCGTTLYETEDEDGARIEAL